VCRSSPRSAWLATRLDGILPECVGRGLAAQLLIADAGHQAVPTLIWRGLQQAVSMSVSSVKLGVHDHDRAYLARLGHSRKR
jgi:hypothetical protein